MKDLMILPKRFLIASTIALIPPVSSHAEQLIVRDCNSNIRASANLQDDSKASIRISHQKGESISLMAAISNENKSFSPSETKDDLSIFKDISSGDWKVCGGHINEVQLFPSSIEKTSNSGLLATGTGILAGSSVIAFAGLGGSNSDSNSEIIETGGASEVAVNNPKTADASSAEAATRCLNDAEVPEMSQSN